MSADQPRTDSPAAPPPPSPPPAPQDLQTRRVLEDLLAALHEPGAIHSAVAAAVCDACRTMLDVLPLAERLRGHVSDGRIMVVVETAAGQRQFDPRRLL